MARSGSIYSDGNRRVDISKYIGVTIRKGGIVKLFSGEQNVFVCLVYDRFLYYRITRGTLSERRLHVPE